MLVNCIAITVTIITTSAATAATSDEKKVAPGIMDSKDLHPRLPYIIPMIPEHMLREHHPRGPRLPTASGSQILA